VSLWQTADEAAVRDAVRAFVQAFAEDFVIGFLFEGKDLERIAVHEFELARAHLGGEGAYAGRPIGKLHGPLRINRGHFRRRLTILRHVLSEEGLPDALIDAWIAHDQSLEDVVTNGIDCLE
jgi:truncated hemoglobin YjbI